MSALCHKVKLLLIIFQNLETLSKILKFAFVGASHQPLGSPNSRPRPSGKRCRGGWGRVGAPVGVQGGSVGCAS